LSVSGPRITDLRPLSHNDNLSELKIGAPQIPGLIDLAHLKSLKKLSIIIEQQQNLNLDPVGVLTSLELLWIWAPNGGQLDVAPLRSLANLRSLSLIGGSLPYLLSSITNIETIGGLTELRTLLISSFPVNNLAFVAKLMNLEELNINQMPISSIEPVRDLKSLKKLSLNLTAVVDISPLLDLPALTELTVGRTPARSDLLAQLEQRGVKVNSY
jgi:internalin A